METKTFNSRKRVLDSSGYESDTEHFFLSGPPRNRRRRDRTHFSEVDLDRLETAFLLDRYPDINTRETLACELGVSEDRIHVWFQNRRSKSRRRQKRQQMTSQGSMQQAQQSQLSPVFTVPHTAGLGAFNPWGSSIPLINPFTAGAFSPAFALPLHNIPVPVTSSLTAPNGESKTPTPPEEDEETQSTRSAPPSECEDNHSYTNTPPGECEEKQVKKEPIDNPGLSSSFKRPWETPSPESQTYRRTRSELLPAPIMYPSGPFVLPPMLPFSPIGTPGNGCLFLPHSFPSPLPFMLPAEVHNMNVN